MSAKLPNSTNIVINGFIQSGGQKMSKSLGNVIVPKDLIDFYKDYAMYPEDVLRFVVLHDLSPFEDSDVTLESIKISYNANLANGLGNLTSRVMRMALSNLEGEIIELNENKLREEISQKMLTESKDFNFQKLTQNIWKDINSLDEFIAINEPFKKVKVEETKIEGFKVIEECVKRLFNIALSLESILPNTSLHIQDLIRNFKMPENPIFNRIN
jgi:methionyl-tRNA synthetase